MTSEMLPCPFCGTTPDANKRETFTLEDQPKWASVNCCITGPEIRTDYEKWPAWKQDAIAAWNTRPAPAASPTGVIPQPQDLPWTDKERHVIATMMEERQLSGMALLRAALRQYQVICERMKAGETCVWSGDAQRMRDFAGVAEPVKSFPTGAEIVKAAEAWGKAEISRATALHVGLHSNVIERRAAEATAAHAAFLSLVSAHCAEVARVVDDAEADISELQDLLAYVPFEEFCGGYAKTVNEIIEHLRAAAALRRKMTGEGG